MAMVGGKELLDIRVLLTINKKNRIKNIIFK